MKNKAKMMAIAVVTMMSLCSMAGIIIGSEESDAFITTMGNDSLTLGESYSRTVTFNNLSNPTDCGTPFVSSPSWMSVSSYDNVTGNDKGTSSITLTGKPTSAGSYSVVITIPKTGSSLGSEHQLTWTSVVNSQITYYTVSYNANGGSGSMSGHTTSSSVTLKDCTFTPPAQKEFIGWKAENSGYLKSAGSSYSPISNVTMYAQWAQSYYVLSFNANGGSGTMGPLNVDVGSDGLSHLSPLPDSTFTPPSGKTFAGWSRSSSGSNMIQAGSVGIGFDTNTTLYAVWLASGESSFVEFKTDNGTAIVNKLYTKTISYGGHYNPDNPGTPYVSGPSWMSVSASDLSGSQSSITLSGTPTTSGTYEVTVVVPSPGASSGVPLHITFTCVVGSDSQKFTVSFNSNGGTGSMSDETVSLGSSLTADCTFIPPSGMKFAGWKANNEGSLISVGSPYTPISNVMMYAQWTQAYYVISFDSNGGSGTMDPVNADIANLKDDPTKAYLKDFDYKACPFSPPSGKTFFYWSTDPTGTIPIQMSTVGFYTDSTIYANWKDNSSSSATSISFDANGGTGSIGVQNVMSGVSITLPTSGFQKDGSYLSGWREGSPTGSHRDVGSPFTVSSSTTMYAEWTALPSTHDQNAVSAATVGSKYIYEPILASNSVWLIYNELAWVTGNEIVIDEKPSWMQLSKSDRATHKITFSGTPTSAGVFKVSVHLSGSGSIPADSAVSWVVTVMNTGDPNHTVSFNGNGGSGSIPESQKVPPNNAVILPGATLAKPGYTMVAWSTVVNGTTVYYPLGSIYTATGDTVFTAYYSADPNIIVLDANGGSSDGGLMSAFIAYTDGQVTLPSSGYTKAGNTFRGWFDQSDPTAIYAPGYILPISGAMTLKAYWIQTGASTVTVTYNANGGTGTLSQIVEPGKKVVLPSSGFDFSGKALTGWTQGSVSGTELGISAKVPISSSATMYAKWTEASQSLHTVSFDLNGGTGSIAVQSVSSGSKAVMPSPPVRSGFLFAGWKVVGGQDWDFDSAVTESMTLQAQWKQHFSVVSDGTKVILTMGSEYASKAASVSWGDSKTSDGSSSSYEHDYGESRTIVITVTSTINGTSYTSSMQVYVSAPQGGDEEPDPEPASKTKEIAIIAIVTIIGSIVCMVLFPPSVILFWILMAAVSVWRFL